MNRLTALFRTTSFRLSALYLLLFAVCAFVLVLYVTSMTERLLQAQTREAVGGELRQLAQSYRYGGIPRLVRSVERRARQPGANLYTIAGPTGEILAGNVASLQPGVLDREGWTQIPFRYERFTETVDEEIHMAMAQIVVLPNGMRLLVGRDLGEPVRLRGLIRRALAVALGIMGIGALAIWLIIGRGALKRIDRMSEASQKIMAGDLSQRLPVSGSGDEFDRLSVSLNTMIARIARLSEGLRQVSDNIAHDLKTPLTRLRNKAEAALAAGADAPGHRAALEDTIAESDQLIRTFNALLMISRVEAGSAAAELSRVDLTAIVTDTVELYEPLAEDAGARLVSQIAAGVTVIGSRELIGQALSNLLDNAIKYASHGDSDAIRVRLRQDDGRICVSVEDSGPGIPEDQLGEVVKRFVRLDQSRSKPGTGLGLSLVDAVMALHGGSLDLHNIDKEGKTAGLRATMAFPADKEGA